MSKSICADCRADTLQTYTEKEQFEYKGHSLSVDVKYSICSQCGSETILPGQIKRNDCRTRDAWRKADGLLSGAEIVALRKKLGLTQQQAAQLFGGGANAFSKYERGEVIQSAAMDKLMRLALENNPVFVAQWLNEQAGFGVEIENIGYGKVIPFKPKSENLHIYIEPNNSIQVQNHG